jgi:hypothetical protein
MLPVNETNAVEVAAAVKAGVLPGPAKSLAEAVCRVMEQVGYVQKDKQMQGGGSYRYVSVEAVIDKLRPEMIKQQLVLLPVGVEVLHQGEHGRQLHLRVKYTFELIHAGSGQTKPVVVVGEGMDVGDKSSNKCMTAARKYALIMAFNIETGLDPDDTPSSEQERKPAATQPAKPAPQQKPPGPEQPPEIVVKHDRALAEAAKVSKEAVNKAMAAIHLDKEAGKIDQRGADYLRDSAAEALAKFRKQPA